jgi:hypothetical protein
VKIIYVVFQEGGSSTELYWHSFDAIKDAEAYRTNAAEGIYRTSEVIETNEHVERLLSACPMPLPDLIDHLQDLAEMAGEVGYP